MMKNFINKYKLIPKLVVFIGLPILILYLSNFPSRTTLKESISIVTILAFSLMIGQFFLSRGYRNINKELKMSNLVKAHKFIGYFFIPILFIHPLLIVVPRFFESGVDPIDAFVTIITTFDSLGVILGIIAWFLMFTIGITSMLRNILSINYKAWRIFHGVLSTAFISVAAWHVIDLGRHSNNAMITFFIVISSGAVLLLLNTYFFNNSSKRVVSK